MPYLARNQANSEHILSLHVVDSHGKMFDPLTVEFTIHLADGTQVYPASGREDVTDYPKAVGVYAAVFEVDGSGWAPDVLDELGSYYITWYWKDRDDTTELTWSQQFWVEDEGLGLPFYTYVSPQELRAEGITIGDVPDARLLSLIKRSQQFIEARCRQPFRKVALMMKVDGNEADTLFPAIPIIGVSAMRINNSTLGLDNDFFEVYAAPSLEAVPVYHPVDHRRNPKITLKSSISLLPTLSSQRGVFDPGFFVGDSRSNEIVGSFGFVEPDGTTPELIREALIRLVVYNAGLLTAGSGVGSVPGGPIKREKTDRHEIEYFQSSAASTSSVSVLSGTEEVDEILKMYRAPMSIGSPTPAWSFR